MEAWQRNYITQKLDELVDNTEFNASVKSKLLAYGVLSRTDVELVDAENNQKGKKAASYKCYDILMTRTGAYRVLLMALEESKQSGAADILKNGLQNCGASNELNEFKGTQIDVQGTKIKLLDFFPPEKLKMALKIFQDTISEEKFIRYFVTKQETFKLANSTIPSEPPIYIPRFLSNRVEINETAFKGDHTDIFVFKNSIERWKLSEIAKPNWTASSKEQLNQIKARFIYLDEYEEWNWLKNKAKKPIHLISYETDKKIYILEDSSGALDFLSRIGSEKRSAYFSEDEFVRQQLSEEFASSSVCICDKPGMGKTYLLANIARVVSKQCNRSIVAFVQLSSFVESSTDPTKEQDTIILNVFKSFSPSPEHLQLLNKLFEEDLLRVEIFFDGFDEIPSDKVEWMKQEFLSIRNRLPNVQMYISSRPHMRHELEKSLGVIAYDILPFNTENQVDYVVRFWSLSYPELDHTALKNYALNCLEKIKKYLPKNAKEMAGIPLLCQLIAEVYSEKVRLYLPARAKNIDVILGIAEMYEQFIRQRIEAVTQNEDEFMNLKLLHICHALKLLFPKAGFHNDGIFERANQLDLSSKVLKAGIMHLESNSKLEVIHRTFAEYFVAEYFSGKLHSTTQKPKTYIQNEGDESKQVLISILNHLLLSTTYRFTHSFYSEFENSVIVSFVDFNLSEISSFEETASTISVYCASLSPENLLSILFSCCQHNVVSIFSLLKAALRKWDRNQKNEYFTTKNCYELLGVCIRESTSQMFHSCIQFITEEQELDLEQIALYDKGYTLLHKAAENGNYEAFEYLIDRVSLELSGVLQECVQDSSMINMDSIKGRENILSLLHNKIPALIKKNPKILNSDRIHVNLFKTLVKLGASLTAIDSYGYNCVTNYTTGMSPLHFHELVEFLLTDCKAEYLFLPNEKWKDPMPIIIRNFELLQETLDLLFNIPGININRKDKDGENLLFSAVRIKKLGNVEQLVNRGLDFNERNIKNESLLHQAARCGDKKMVRYLLHLKLDVNSEDVNKQTPLHYAAFNYFHSFSIVETLVENGANVQAKTHNGQTALHIAVTKPYCVSSDLSKYLIRNGVGVNARDNNGNTPLHLCEDKNVRDYLIEMGADIHATNKNGQTVLHTTASKGNASCDEIKYLITNGVGVNDRDNNGVTPLHLCQSKYVRDCLIEMGADIHAINKYGYTPAQTKSYLWK